MPLIYYQSHQIHEKEPLLNTILLQSSQAEGAFEAQAENSSTNFNNMWKGGLCVKIMQDFTNMFEVARTCEL